MNISNTSANSVLQTTAPRQLLGQTVALHMLAVRGGVSLGSLFTGMSVSLLGVRQALIINGVLAIAAHLLVGQLWLGSRSTKSRPEPHAKQ
jgi:hypothetical protein